MSRLCCLLLLILIDGASTTEVKKGNDKPHSSVSEEPIVHDTEGNLVLTKAICTDGHRSAYVSRQCCDMYVENDSAVEYCLAKVNKEHPTDKIAKMKRYSKFTECIYTRKKYIKDSNNLNIGHVKADAAKLRDSFAQKFMVDMYRECGHKAKNLTSVIEDKSEATQQEIERLQSLHKPYFMFLYSCVTFYSRKHQCPYFRWGSGKKTILEKCTHYSQQCKTLMKKK